MVLQNRINNIRVQSTTTHIKLIFNGKGYKYYPDIDIETCFSNMADNGLNPEIDKYAWMTFDELKEKTHRMHINFYEQIIEMVS